MSWMVIAVVCLAPAQAAQPVESRSYAIADLCLKTADVYPLIKTIQGQIDPGSWSHKGGPAGIGFCPITWQIVVLQTPARHQRIAQLLEATRKARGKK